MKGWVKLYREQFNNPISKKPWCDGYAWSYLYSQANHKKGTVNFRNEYIEIKRGQFLTSKIKLEKVFEWTRRHTENFLKALKNDEMITYRVTNRYIVITIVNYMKYQSNGEQDDIQNNKQVTNRRQTDDKQVSINKNVKNVKNDKNVKKIYMDVVRLTDIEYNKLIKELGESLAKEKIKDLSLYIQSKGKKYKSHYATILTWCRKDKKEVKNEPDKYKHLEETY